MAGYKIFESNGKRYHDYGNGRVVYVSPSKPGGYNSYDPNKKLWYKTSDNGLDKTITWQNKQSEKRPGSAANYYGQDRWNLANALTNAKYAGAEKLLNSNQATERGAQDQAYKQIGSYYAGLANNAKDLMGQVGQSGAQTDQSLQQIGAQRNQQIQQATPQYQGPLGSVAQSLADQEQQAALNRGASMDAANRTAQTGNSGARQVFAGQFGAGQQVVGQERLALAKGQGSQVLKSYADQLSKLSAEKPFAAVDTASQLLTADRTYGLNQQKIQTTSDKNAADAQYKQDQIALGQQRNDIARQKGNQPKPKKSATHEQNNSFWANVNKWNGATNDKTKLPASYQDILGQTGDPVIAAIVRSLRHNGNRLTPEAVNILHNAGYSVGGRYGLTGQSGKTVLSSLADSVNALGKIK